MALGTMNAGEAASVAADAAGASEPGCMDRTAFPYREMEPRLKHRRYARHVDGGTVAGVLDRGTGEFMHGMEYASCSWS